MEMDMDCTLIMLFAFILTFHLFHCNIITVNENCVKVFEQEIRLIHQAKDKINEYQGGQIVIGENHLFYKLNAKIILKIDWKNILYHGVCSSYDTYEGPFAFLSVSETRGDLDDDEQELFFGMNSPSDTAYDLNAAITTAVEQNCTPNCSDDSGNFDDGWHEASASEKEDDQQPTKFLRSNDPSDD